MELEREPVSGARILVIGGSESEFELLRARLPGASVVEWVEGGDAAARRLGRAWAADLLDGAPDPVLVATLEGALLYKSKSADETFPELAEQGARHPLLTGLAEAFGESMEFEREVRVGTRYFLERGRLEDSKVSLYCTDTTERRLIASRLAQAERLATAGEIAAGVAHEANNPLTYLIANLTLLEETCADSPERAELLASSREAAERISRILKDMKSFARPPEPAEAARGADVARALEAALALAGNEIRHRAKLERELPRVPLVRGDEARLTQVFLNLLLNAVHAIPAGSSDRNSIRVRLGEADGRVIAEVADTGPGVSPELRERIFEPFFTTKAESGTGLGLSICRALVESMGGELQLVPTSEGGACFRISLRAHEVAGAAGVPVFGMGGSVTTSVSATATAKASGGRRGRVLVVDDEPAIASALRACLGREHEVEVCSSGREGLRAVLEREFDIILCDVMMPEVTGMEIHRRLALEYPGREKRIVFMTGGAFTAAAREFLDTVGNLKLDKPFDLKAIRILVSERLDARPQAR
jgi:signal transduction histidine kinase/ActR/RegA family two-component response regulator